MKKHLKILKRRYGDVVVNKKNMNRKSENCIQVVSRVETPEEGSSASLDVFCTFQ